MTVITSVSMWNDPGFTETCVEVPAYANLAVLPAADYTQTEDIAPSKGRWFSEMRLKVNYEAAKSWSYLKVEVDWNNNISNSIYYGWVEKVELVSDSEDYPQVAVYWHVDLWRTYFGSATFGYGMVRRAPAASLSDYPLQNVPYIRKEETSRYVLTSLSSLTITYNGTLYYIYWLIICYVNAQGSPVWTAFPFPLDKDGRSPDRWLYSFYGTHYDGSTGWMTKNFDNTANVLYGSIVNDMGISQSSVTGAFVSDIPPIYVDKSQFTLDTSGSDPVLSVYYRPKAGTGHFTFKTYVVDVGGVPDETTRVIWVERPMTAPPVTSMVSASLDSYVSSESATAEITGYDGGCVSVLPDRFVPAYFLLTVVVSPTAASLEVAFTKTSSVDADNVREAKASGRTVLIPFPRFSLGTSSWGEYTVTGQRQYAIEQRHTANRLALESGLMGSAASAAQGAMLGGLRESQAGGKDWLPTARSIGNMAGFGALGAAGSVIGSLGSYAVAELNADGLQGLEDARARAQPDNLGNAGDAMWWTVNYRSPALVLMSKDAWSLGVYASELSLNGAAVTMPTADITTLAHGTGPLQVTDAVVRGPIPVEAKRYIKGRLAAGVRLT